MRIIKAIKKKENKGRKGQEKCQLRGKGDKFDKNDKK